MFPTSPLNSDQNNNIPHPTCVHIMLVQCRPNAHNTTNTSSSTSNGSSFQHFFQVWVRSQQSYMNQLLFLSSSQKNHSLQEDELKSLVAEVSSHYQSYYDAKSIAAQGDIFLLYSPSWFSSFERTFLWITGFKPTLAFNILAKSIGGELTVEQVAKLQRLKLETRAMEKVLSDRMTGVQESVAGTKLVQAVMEGQVTDRDMDPVVEMIKNQLRNLVVSADFLRTKTAAEIVEILSPVQAAKFLAATARFQLKIRTLGLQRDADRMSS